MGTGRGQNLSNFCLPLSLLKLKKKKKKPKNKTVINYLKSCKGNTWEKLQEKHLNSDSLFPVMVVFDENANVNKHKFCTLSVCWKRLWALILLRWHLFQFRLHGGKKKERKIHTWGWILEGRERSRVLSWTSLFVACVSSEWDWCHENWMQRQTWGCVCVVVKSAEHGVSVKGSTATPGSGKNVPIFSILNQVSALSRSEEG